MSKVADSIRCGLKEAVVYAKGGVDGKTYRVHVPEQIYVKAIRMNLDLRGTARLEDPFASAKVSE